MLVQNKWIPVLTSEAGLCLTTANWQEAKINTAVYYLDALLLKPGIDLLKQVPNLAYYVNWSGEVIINASRLKANKAGVIRLKSPYDGSILSIDYIQLFELINHLKPQKIILPADILINCPQFEDLLNKNIIPYFLNEYLPSDNSVRDYGIYFELKDNLTLIDKQFSLDSIYPLYIQGRLNLEQIKQLASLSTVYIESELPAEQGLNGFIFSDDLLLDLKNEEYVFSYEKLSKQCQCASCKNNLTRAYLHHLYTHTPLLAQRFLIQHNAFYVQNLLNKMGSDKKSIAIP